jgi:predicted hotdog family 3-hydroxylacyl-ACP dehydratase
MDLLPEQLTFPIPVLALSHLIPHRGPMLWIDQVLEVNEREGRCLTHPLSSKHDQSPDELRQTCYIEWIAQSYAFIKSAQLLTGHITGRQNLTRFFLAAVKNAETKPLRAASGPFTIWVGDVREMGPITMITGKVYDTQQTLMAQASLKVFSD